MHVVNALDADRDLDLLIAEKILKFERFDLSGLGYKLINPKTNEHFTEAEDNLPRFSSSMEASLSLIKFIRNDVFPNRLKFSLVLKNILSWQIHGGDNKIQDWEVILHAEPNHIAIAALVAYNTATFKGSA